MLLLLTVLSACCPQASPALSPHPAVSFLLLKLPSLPGSPGRPVPMGLSLCSSLADNPNVTGPCCSPALAYPGKLPESFPSSRRRSELEGNFLHHILNHYFSFYFFLSFPPSLIMLEAKVKLKHVASMHISLPFFLWVRWVQQRLSVPGQREIEALSGADNTTNHLPGPHQDQVKWPGS